MAAFAVHRNRDPRTAATYPYLVDIQNDLFDDLQTRVVIPAMRAESWGRLPLNRLMPLVMIEDAACLLMTPQLAGVARAVLGEYVADLTAERNDIIGAVDFLMSGV